MKTQNVDLYWNILQEYLKGDGIDFARHGINKKDIPEMVCFYQRYIRKDTADGMILAIIYELIET